MTSEQVENLMAYIKNKTANIINFEKQINQYKMEIKKTELTLWNTCKHEEWVYCTACAFDDPCKWYCRKCKLWKDKRLYE